MYILRDFETFASCLNAVKRTSLLNDGKCVKILAVYARFCTQAYGDLFCGVVP